jgi:hypothetical protein
MNLRKTRPTECRSGGGGSKEQENPEPDKAFSTIAQKPKTLIFAPPQHIGDLTTGLSRLQHFPDHLPVQEVCTGHLKSKKDYGRYF